MYFNIYIYIYSYIDIFHFDNVGFDIGLRNSLKGEVKFEQENWMTLKVENSFE